MIKPALTITDVTDLNRSAILQEVMNDGYACVRGFIDPNDILNAREAISAQFSATNDHPACGESPEQVRGNFQKFCLGGVLPHGDSCGRAVRTFYNGLDDDDCYQMHSIFRKLIKLRNYILDVPSDFPGPDDKLWNAARIHQYPIGGGFMDMHLDSYVPKITRDLEVNYIQLLLLMSQKPQDFTRGGGIVETHGERVILEDHYQMGDVAIYNGKSWHGVMDIDPHRKFEWDKFSGRLSALVTLYKEL